MVRLCDACITTLRDPSSSAENKNVLWCMIPLPLHDVPGAPQTVTRSTPSPARSVATSEPVVCTASPSKTMRTSMPRRAAAMSSAEGPLRVKEKIATRMRDPGAAWRMRLTIASSTAVSGALLERRVENTVVKCGGGGGGGGGGLPASRTPPASTGPSGTSTAPRSIVATGVSSGGGGASRAGTSVGSSISRSSMTAASSTGWYQSSKPAASWVGSMTTSVLSLQACSAAKRATTKGKERGWRACAGVTIGRG